MGSDDVPTVLDVSCQEAWDRLGADTSSVLIDVRTRAEWSFVGLPDLSQLGKEVVKVEWQTFPDNQIDSGFVDHVQTALQAAGIGKDAELLFICRSGGRSRMAAEALTAQGYMKCRNVADGFEGPLDPNRHRGAVGGWKVAGLPWVQA